MSTHTKTVNYRGITLDLTGDLTPAEGDGFHSQRYEKEFSLEEVTLADDDVNIIELFNSEQIRKLEKLALGEE